MILIPQDFALLAYCLALPALFEVFRIALGYLLAGPSSKIGALETEKLLVLKELRGIKSVQLELVRNSKLERKVIKIDKEIEAIKAEQEPKIAKTKKMLRFLRMAVYAALCFLVAAGPVAQISPRVMWPFSWISSEQLMPLYSWFVVVVAGAASRHVLRSILPLMASPSSFP